MRQLRYDNHLMRAMTLRIGLDLITLFGVNSTSRKPIAKRMIAVMKKATVGSAYRWSASYQKCLEKGQLSGTVMLTLGDRFSPVSSLILALPSRVEVALIRAVAIEGDRTVKPWRTMHHHHAIHGG